MKEICIIGVVGVPASYGGFETLAERLVDSEKMIFTVYCSKKHYQEYPKEYKNAKLVYVPLDANGISSIIYDIFSMLHAIISGHKNFLILGVSGAIFFPILRCFPKVQIVTNIDGIEWQRDKWKGFAKIFLKFSEYLAVKYSHDVISDNSAITSYVSKSYKRDCKTIAYGGDHALRMISSNNFAKKNTQHNYSSYALSICRIEPENNIHVILDAFTGSKLPIIFIGNWQKSSYGRELYSKYNNKFNISLLNPIYCLDTLFDYRASCSVYIHGHSAGGTNPSLVEMMHFSKPIIAFDCSYNRATMEDKGNYFFSSKDLTELLNKSDSLMSGDILVEIARRRYTWDIVRKEYLTFFNK